MRHHPEILFRLRHRPGARYHGGNGGMAENELKGGSFQRDRVPVADRFATPGLLQHFGRGLAGS